MLIGQSAPMLDLRRRIERIAGTHFTVLIEGESGSGKELVAHAIHEWSPRRSGPFVAVNCAALVETLVEAELFGIEERTASGVRGRRGKFELADHGTLFLDEVGDLSGLAQAKLLRVLQDFTVERVGGHVPHRLDTRVVAATNRDLHDLVAQGRFRADLFYRLAGVDLRVPPLRARRQDIPLLIDHFRGTFRRTRSLGFSQAALDVMVSYEWPGNVRQLGRVVERALALAEGPEVTAADLPPEISGIFPEVPVDDGQDRTLRAWSRRYARLVLERCAGNKRRACDVLDITYHTLQSLLETDSAAVRPMTALRMETGGLCERAG